jgi:hypothetical protein
LYVISTGRTSTSHKTAINNSEIKGIGDDRGVYRVLVGKPEGKRPFGETKT